MLVQGNVLGAFPKIPKAPTGRHEASVKLIRCGFAEFYAKVPFVEVKLFL